MFEDSSLERSSQWATYIGPGIGGPVPYVPPTSYTITPPTNLNEWMQVAIAGPGYTDMMAALHRPLMPFFDPAQVPLEMEFDMMTDLNAPTKAQAIEFETCVCDAASYYYNGSLQINYVNPAGELQAYQGVSVPWGNTGIMVPALTPFQIYHFRIGYLLNTVARTMSIQWIEIDGKRSQLPPQFQNTPATLKSPPWAPGLYVQYQLDLAFAGGAFAIYVSNVRNNWR